MVVDTLDNLRQGFVSWNQDNLRQGFFSLVLRYRLIETLSRRRHIEKLQCAITEGGGHQLACRRAVAQVSAQIFCSQCSRLRFLAQGAQLNSLKTLLAADIRRSLPILNGL